MEECFLLQFLFVAKSGNHSQKDLVKAGYIPDMKYKNNHQPSISLAIHTQNQNIKFFWQLENFKFISFF
jgi:hypothetical protein